jgi:hypothetical protein
MLNFDSQFHVFGQNIKLHAGARSRDKEVRTVQLKKLHKNVTGKFSVVNKFRQQRFVPYPTYSSSRILRGQKNEIENCLSRDF